NTQQSTLSALGQKRTFRIAIAVRFTPKSGHSSQNVVLSDVLRMALLSHFRISLVRRAPQSGNKLSPDLCSTAQKRKGMTYERARPAVAWCNVSSSHSIQPRSDTVAFALCKALPVATEAGGGTRHLRHQFGGELPHRQGEALTAGGVAHRWLASGQDRARHRHLRPARHYLADTSRGRSGLRWRADAAAVLLQGRQR